MVLQFTPTSTRVNKQAYCTTAIVTIGVALVLLLGNVYSMQINLPKFSMIRKYYPSLQIKESNGDMNKMTVIQLPPNVFNQLDAVVWQKIKSTIKDSSNANSSTDIIGYPDPADSTAAYRQSTACRYIPRQLQFTILQQNEFNFDVGLSYISSHYKVAFVVKDITADVWVYNFGPSGFSQQAQLKWDGHLNVNPNTHTTNSTSQPNKTAPNSNSTPKNASQNTTNSTSTKNTSQSDSDSNQTQYNLPYIFEAQNRILFTNGNKLSLFLNNEFITLNFSNPKKSLFGQFIKAGAGGSEGNLWFLYRDRLDIWESPELKNIKQREDAAKITFSLLKSVTVDDQLFVDCVSTCHKLLLLGSHSLTVIQPRVDSGVQKIITKLDDAQCSRVYIHNTIVSLVCYAGQVQYIGEYLLAPSGSLILNRYKVERQGVSELFYYGKHTDRMFIVSDDSIYLSPYGISRYYLEQTEVELSGDHFISMEIQQIQTISDFSDDDNTVAMATGAKFLALFRTFEKPPVIECNITQVFEEAQPGSDPHNEQSTPTYPPPNLSLTPPSVDLLVTVVTPRCNEEDDFNPLLNLCEHVFNFQISENPIILEKTEAFIVLLFLIFVLAYGTILVVTICIKKIKQVKGVTGYVVEKISKLKAQRQSKKQPM